MNRVVAGAVAFLTSAAVLIMEIVASRLLAPYVGVTLETYTAIIGVVLAGISLGAWLGGRLADRGDPVRNVCFVLIGGGGLVFASLFLLRLAAKVFDGEGPSNAVMLVVCAFLAPATVLSMETPMLVKSSLTDLERTGREVGRISALSTAGAIVGTFVSGFLLVATIPSPMIMLIVGAVLVIMGVALWFTSRKTDSRGGAVPVAMAVLATGLGATVPLHKTPCDVETAYFCANVIEEGKNVRVLQLDTLLHSAQDLSDDTNLIFEYTLSIGTAIDSHWPKGQPITAMHIGGGGFTIPRYVRATRAGSDNLVIERDPKLVELDRERLGLVTDEKLRVRSVDGRIAIRDAKAGSLDLVVGDAFGGEAVPWHLATKEFTAQIHRALRSDGLYAANVIDGAPAKFVRAEVATVKSVFAHVAVVAPEAAFTGEYGSNYIVLASKEPLKLDALRARHSEASVTDKILAGDELTAWVGKARVLTDAFAPVDQLLTSEVE